MLGPIVPAQVRGFGWWELAWCGIRSSSARGKAAWPISLLGNPRKRPSRPAASGGRKRQQSQL